MKRSDSQGGERTSAANYARRWVTRCALLGLLLPPLALSVSTGQAQPHTQAPQPLPPASSLLWQGVRNPHFARSRTLLRHGLRKLAQYQRRLREAQNSGMLPSGSLLNRGNAPAHLLRGVAVRGAILEGAIRRFQMAHELAPEDPEALYLLAYATSRLERLDENGNRQRMDDAAILLFKSLRGTHPHFEPEAVAQELATLFHRTRQFAEASDEFSRALHLGSMPEGPGTATTLANWAEVEMLQGHLEQSVQLFEKALDRAQHNGEGTELILFGLSLALDRLGETDEAVELAARAARGNEGMARLRSATVFFEPSYELHWYESLGYEALARHASTSTDRHQLWQRAVMSIRAFLREGGATGHFADAARARLARLQSAGAKADP